MVILSSILLGVSHNLRNAGITILVDASSVGSALIKPLADGAIAVGVFFILLALATMVILFNRTRWGWPGILVLIMLLSCALIIISAVVFAQIHSVPGTIQTDFYAADDETIAKTQERFWCCGFRVFNLTVGRDQVYAYPCNGIATNTTKVPTDPPTGPCQSSLESSLSHALKPLADVALSLGILIPFFTFFSIFLAGCILGEQRLDIIAAHTRAASDLPSSNAVYSHQATAAASSNANVAAASTRGSYGSYNAYEAMAENK